jgi:hypothetical protein
LERQCLDDTQAVFHPVLQLGIEVSQFGVEPDFPFRPFF